MGASDRILAGESTFMLEMKETASILREADSRSFVLIDEIGRGTSTTDGLAIARAVLEHMHEHTRALCVFATHYHELSEDASRLKHAFNASMGIREWKGSLVFLRKLVREAAQSSYGLYVAKLAGLPRSVLAHAKKEHQRLLDLEARKQSTTVSENQMDLFSAGSAVVVEGEGELCHDHSESLAELERHRQILGKLSDIDLDSLSPREAWTVLEEQVTKAKELR